MSARDGRRTEFRPDNISSSAPGRQGQSRKLFFASLPKVFVYPFQGLGWAALIAGAGVFWVLDRVGITIGSPGATSGIRTGGGAAVALFATVYLGAYMVEIIGSAAKGEDSPPDWPDVTYPWANIVQPMLLVVANALVSFAPLIAYRLARHYGVQYVGGCFWALVALGSLYLPMGLLAVGLYRSVEGLNPLMILRAIVKVGRAYLVAAAVFFVNIGLAVFLARYARGLIPHVGSILAGAVWFYLLMVEMRILGTLYRAYEKRLGWFS